MQEVYGRLLILCLFVEWLSKADENQQPVFEYFQLLPRVCPELDVCELWSSLPCLQAWIDSVCPNTPASNDTQFRFTTISNTKLINMPNGMDDRRVTNADAWRRPDTKSRKPLDSRQLIIPICFTVALQCSPFVHVKIATQHYISCVWCNSFPTNSAARWCRSGQSIDSFLKQLSKDNVMQIVCTFTPTLTFSLMRSATRNGLGAHRRKIIFEFISVGRSHLDMDWKVHVPSRP